MKSGALRFLCASLSAICVMSGSASTYAQDDSAAIAEQDDNFRARALFRAGVAAYGEGKNEDARKALLGAWSLRQTYDVAAALAQSELALKRDREAAEHLQFCLRHFAPIESEQTLQQIQSAFSNVKARVATLELSVDQEGSAVSVDDRSMGLTPLSAPLFLDPGVHELAAVKGGDRVSRTVRVDAGRVYRMTLKLGAALTGVPERRGASAASVTASRDGERTMLPTVIGGSVFAVALVAAVGFKLAASSDGNEAARLAEKNGRSGCYGAAASSSDCLAQREAAEGKDRYNNWAFASALVAGAAALGTSAYWVWPRSSEQREAQPKKVRLSGAALPGTAGVWLSGSF